MLRGNTGWREVEIGRGFSDLTGPVAVVETWLAWECSFDEDFYRVPSRVRGRASEVPVLVFGRHRLADDIGRARAGEEVVILVGIG